VPTTLMTTVPNAVRFAALPLAIAAAWAQPAASQSPSQSPDPALAPVVVTATRSESRADEVLSEVVVIDRAAIERQAGRSFTELLAREAGIQFSSNGGIGKVSSLYIRGTEDRHALLLVDGVRYGSATLGTSNFDGLAIDDIERIEVLKGPASALYGSDAVGGVVQVFTRRGREGFRPRASATIGSYGRRELGAGFDGGTGRLGYALSVRRLRDDGFSSTNPRAPFGSYNGDKDSFEQDSLNASFDWRLTDAWRLDATAYAADGTSRYDSGPGDFDARADVRSRVLSAGIEGRITQAWTTRVAIGDSDDRSTYYGDGFPDSRFDTRQTQWLWQNRIETVAGRVLAGYERLEQRVDSTTDYTVTQRSIDSLFAGINGSQGPHRWQANARRDDNSQFGDANTWLAAYGYRITPSLSASLSHGTSFKAPSFNQLYFPDFGNPDLQPERGRNTEGGLEYVDGAHRFRAIRFDNRIEGFITSTTVAENVPKARIQGWTLSYGAQWGPLGLRAAFDLLDAMNEVTLKELPRRADRQLTLGADWALGRGLVGAQVLALSERWDDVANTQRLPGFATFDVYAEMQLGRDWRLQARLDNLADKAYETAYGYNQPGRAAYLTVRWQPR